MQEQLPCEHYAYEQFMQRFEISSNILPSVSHGKFQNVVEIGPKAVLNFSTLDFLTL